MVSRSLEAAETLAYEGIDTRVLEMHTIKSLDLERLEQAARETGGLVTVEEHSIVGGLGGAVSEAVSAVYPVPVVRVGIADCFAETGPYSALLDRYGMSAADIVAAAQKAIALKSR